MYNESLHRLFSGKVFQVPGYQSGYTWEEKQWDDLIKDIDALVTDGRISSHYMGTIVTYNPQKEKITYDLGSSETVDVVDGQERLITLSLFLSEMLRTLIVYDQIKYRHKIADYLHDYNMTKLRLNNDTNDIFTALIKEGNPRQEPTTENQKRLCRAIGHFRSYLQKKLEDPAKGMWYIEELFIAISWKIRFTYYEIEEEHEIGITLECMKSRGKRKNSDA